MVEEVKNEQSEKVATKKTQFLVVKIPKPQNIERIGWICVTLVLAFLAFYNPIGSLMESGTGYVVGLFDGGSDDISGNVVVEAPEEVKEPEPVVVEEPEEKPLSGLIEFEIIKVNTVKKADDWGKITSVEYKIINEKKDFYPLIQVYAYDESDTSEVKNLIKGELESINPVNAGDTKTGVVTLDDGSFDELTAPKTVTVHLLDQASEKVLKAVTTIITIS